RPLGSSAEDRHMPTRSPLRRPVPTLAASFGRRRAPIAWLVALVVATMLGQASLAGVALAGGSGQHRTLEAGIAAQGRLDFPRGAAADHPYGGAQAPGGAPPAPPAADEDAPPAGLQPTIQYEEAMAHANDPNGFTPGARVALGYAPRADDGWPVDGGRPVALPAGRASGREMAQAAQGSRWANSPPAGLSDDPAT